MLWSKAMAVLGDVFVCLLWMTLEDSWSDRQFLVA